MRDGKKIDGFSYDQATDSGQFSLNININSKNDIRVKALKEELDSIDLDHTFSFSFASGRFSLKGGVTIGSTKPKRISKRDSSIDLVVQKFKYPIVITKENALKPPNQLVQSALINPLQVLPLQLIKDPQWFAAQSVYLVLHETIEVGLLDSYISSSDRRWICDGVANYLAWQTIKDFAGIEFANKAYNTGYELYQYKDLQSQIDLSKWKATEDQHETEADHRLNSAHYPFATRAIFNFVEDYGENAIADLWKRVGKTPRRKTDMKTVAKAYQKLTGQTLSKLIEAAENDPIPIKPPNTTLPN